MPEMAKPFAPQNDLGKTTFFYHIHVPKTGGTSIGNLLTAYACTPWATDYQVKFWDNRCTQPCLYGLADTFISCYSPDRPWREHSLLRDSLWYGEAFKKQSGAQNLVYVTTLRRCQDRVISHWKFEIKMDTWLPPDGVETMSDQSLKLYITGGASKKCSYLCDNPSQRVARQVAHMASVDASHVINWHDVEVAKQALMTGSWLIGFTECMDEFHRKLQLWSHKLHGGFHKKLVPHVSFTAFQEVSEAADMQLSKETADLLHRQCALDNALYDWAWNAAQTNEDGRFSNTC